MRSVLYVSSAVKLFSPHELLELLRVSRANNQRDGLTGMLLYRGGNFMQLLEGPEPAISRTLDRIAADPRHNGLQTLLDRPGRTAAFEGWDMGFENLDGLSADDRNEVHPFLRDDLTAQVFKEQPEATFKLLTSFRESLR